MSQITTEISSEVNKIYKICFTFVVKKAGQIVLNVLSFPINIPGLTACHLEVHPYQRSFTPSLISTALVFRMHPTMQQGYKQRTVKLEVKTLNDTCCYWRVDEFPYSGGAIRLVKDDFMNQFCLMRCYWQDIILKGIVTIKEMNWQEASVLFETGEMRQQKLIRDIHSLFTSVILSDFTFVVQERKMKVHKAILAARSPVFKRMFTGNVYEATAKIQVIEDIPAGVFEELLYFLYTGDRRNQEIYIENLLYVAVRYEVTDLLRRCEMELLTSINDDNAEYVYNLANRFQCSPELKKISFQILQSKFARISVFLPNEFISKPEKVFRSFEIKKNLENAVLIATSEPSSDEECDQSNNFHSDDGLDSSFPSIPGSSLNEDSSRNYTGQSTSDISIANGTSFGSEIWVNNKFGSEHSFI